MSKRMSEQHSPGEPDDSPATLASPAAISRREIIHLAGATASMASLPMAIAQPAKTVVAARLTSNVVSFVVNGEPREVGLDIRQSLLDVLRENLDLTGTKKGCNQGACGACTILVNGKRILACLTLATMHAGARIETIEGLEKNGELHPLQRAFIEHDGLQCGFCTAGQIMSGLGCISEGHTSSLQEIQYWMSGNICRCGAYPGILAAVADAAKGG
jgi:xanthine dehydrogenase YagT iron-sulfur-binding subunit